MPIPPTEKWRPEWGGALELYPVKIGADGTEEPLTVPSNVIPPSWNQFVFFEVQPGHSFHSVEEVVVDDGGCDRQRLSISGWFHKAQEGEEGYEGEEAEKPKSSLEQLVCLLIKLLRLVPELTRKGEFYCRHQPQRSSPLTLIPMKFSKKSLRAQISHSPSNCQATISPTYPLSSIQSI